MLRFEVIYAIREREYSHDVGPDSVYVPKYTIERRQFNARNKERAIMEARRRKRNIQGDFTAVRILSVSTDMNGPVPKYETF